MESIHGHEVLRMMIALERPQTREALRRLIDERFGSDARFHTCAADGMTADELIDFLVARGKLRPVAGGWRVEEGEICGDDG